MPLIYDADLIGRALTGLVVFDILAAIVMQSLISRLRDRTIRSGDPNFSVDELPRPGFSLSRDNQMSWLNFVLFASTRGMGRFYASWVWLYRLSLLLTVVGVGRLWWLGG